MSKVEITCNVQGAVTLEIEMEFATKAEVLKILEDKGIRSQLAHALTSILDHSYDYTARSPDDCRIAWHEDGNRDAYVREVAGVSLRVADFVVHSPE